MPVKRRAGKRRETSELTHEEWAFIVGAPDPEEPDGGWWMLEHDFPTFRTDRPTVREMWDTHGAKVVAMWAKAHPGHRPPLWWTYDAPEHARRRIGGIGTPAHECSAYALKLDRGVPRWWIWPTCAWSDGFLANYGVAPENPPTFESEATYLERLGLLLPGERKRIGRAGWEPWCLGDDVPAWEAGND